MENYFEYAQYSCEKIAEHVWHIQDATHSNPAGLHDDGSFNNPSSIYVIEDTTQVLVIDLGNPYHDDHLRCCVDRIANNRQIKVAITHHHFDHVGALAQFQDCPVYVPVNDPIDHVQYPIPVQGQDTIDLDHWHFEVLDVPGHTAGSIAFYEPTQGWFATGDAFGSSYVWLLFIPDVIQVYRETLKQTLARLNGSSSLLFLCGHRYQQQIQPVKGIHPLSPKNPHMDIHYLEDMLTLTEKILTGTADHHEFKVFERDDLAAYTYGQAEIDTYLLGHDPITL